MNKGRKIPQRIKEQYGMETTLSGGKISKLEAATAGQQPVELDIRIADSKAKAT